MSNPKKYPPYKVVGDGDVVWITDANGQDVVTNVGFSRHYYDIYNENIMQLICDKLNEIETQ